MRSNQQTEMNFSFRHTFQMSGGGFLPVWCIAIHEIPVSWCYSRGVGIDLSWKSQMGEEASERERVGKKTIMENEEKKMK